MCLSNTDMFGKRRFAFQTKKTPAASLFSRKQGLGAPIHIKTPSISIDIYYYTLLVLLISIILMAY